VAPKELYIGYLVLLCPSFCIDHVITRPQVIYITGLVSNPPEIAYLRSLARGCSMFQ